LLRSKKSPEQIAEEKKPFWKKTYKIGDQEVNLKREYIELQIERAAYQCSDNPDAYMLY
jgi:hypothetical protein